MALSFIILWIQDLCITFLFTRLKAFAGVVLLRKFLKRHSSFGDRADGSSRKCV